tara:strand:- start:478 stop:618 length:141 start_codon:yes stop_codon:yes gene_type:complete
MSAMSYNGAAIIGALFFFFSFFVSLRRNAAAFVGRSFPPMSLDLSL